MTLIKSISGIRGTIGGQIGEGLNPLDLTRFTAAYAFWIKQKNEKKTTIIVGRDARISGEMVNHVVIGTLLGMGCDVIDIGLATTPTTEVAVQLERAAGGIILTASHNPKQWNALKLLNGQGEFLNALEGEEVLQIAESGSYRFAPVDELGKLTYDSSFTQKHIEKVLSLPLVNIEAIYRSNFTVAIDCVNSVGGIAIPELLKALGVNTIEMLNCTPNGNFAHNPEPLPDHLTEISGLLKQGNVDVGFVVDPDVDRLAIICEDGSMFGEEYTLVSVADYVLAHTTGNTVSNKSSTRALRDITMKHGGQYTASAVGEVNVVEKMKATQAIIGGEGNGGVIYPECHYGRDALVGIALFLSHLAISEMKPTELRRTYPAYFMAKKRMDLTSEIDVDKLLQHIANQYTSLDVSTIDGVKIDFPTSWVHLRKSNTEPIIRIYTEAPSQEEANRLADQFISEITTFIA
ncbi:phosphoglucosamine mutase [Microbacter margulisiae]|uniref:Phosphomannomutase n=1 Tax=Microbacter margulisiae TaxID=1350067 RepID=A0A7W5H129_9PORP|nr:phosphoglucosamine mutase [Microbacter margulisiae]MBB3186275.1 phosphomannomutase [Microbacter margulisiae]